MEAAKSEDEKTEEHGDERTDHAHPVLLGDLPINFATAQICILWVIRHLVIVDYDIGYAQGREQNDSQCQMNHKDVKETIREKASMAGQTFIFDDEKTYL